MFSSLFAIADCYANKDFWELKIVSTKFNAGFERFLETHLFCINLTPAKVWK